MEDIIRIDPSAKIGRHFEFEGEVTVGKNTVIGNGVKISGTIAIGDNCKIRHHIEITGNGYIYNGSEIGHDIHNPRIGKNCIIKGEVVDSVIEDGCEIGENAQVTRCHFGVGVKMKHFSGARDAEIGDYTNFSEGSTIANFDGIEKRKTVIGAYVMVGVHARIMGGVIIGDECFVAAGAHVDKNLPQSTYFNPGKAATNKNFHAMQDNRSWYLYGNYLALDKAVGEKYRRAFVNEIIKKFGANADEIKKWLKAPIQKIGGRTPIQYIKEEGCDALEALLPATAEAAKENQKAEAVMKLKEAVKTYVEDPELWMNIKIPTGPLFGKTPKEVVEMQGEKIIPLMTNFAKTGKIH